MRPATFTARLAAALLPALLCFSAAVQAEVSRTALVIGNGAYPNAPLKNPVNDARAMGNVLKTLGFEVILRTDADQRGMDDAVAEFGKRLQKGGVGLFYYAGHGIQSRGRNYLIPVDARIEREKDLKYRAVDMGTVLDEMGYANNGLNIAILDACRNNPLTREFRTGKRGLARLSDLPTGLLLAYSTSPGGVAKDGEGANSPYTLQLMEAIQQRDRPLELVFKDVIKGVKRETGGKQIPWVSSSVSGDFYFLGGDVTVQIQPPPTGQFELRFWNSVEKRPSKTMYQAYLEQYPDGHFAAIARERLHRIETDAAQVPVIIEAIEAESEAEPRPADLLRACRAHLNANRLTVGKGGNAADCYADVLALEQGNTEALAGLDAILGRYKGLIDAVLKQGNLPTARVYLRRMEGLNADSPLVVGLQQRIARLEVRARQKADTGNVEEPESLPPVQVVQQSMSHDIRNQRETPNTNITNDESATAINRCGRIINGTGTHTPYISVRNAGGPWIYSVFA